MIWKNEAALWNAIKKVWDKEGIGHTRIESPLSPGFPDIVAYRNNKVSLVELKLSRLKQEKSTIIRNDQFIFHRKLFLKYQTIVVTLTGVQETGEILVFLTGPSHMMATHVSNGWRYPETAIQHHFSSLSEVNWNEVL